MPDNLTMRINFHPKAGYVTLNRPILETLNNPSHLNFFWGAGKRVLAISAAAEITENSVVLPKRTYTSRGCIKIRKTTLAVALRKLMGFIETDIVDFQGEFLPELEMIVFESADYR